MNFCLRGSGHTNITDGHTNQKGEKLDHLTCLFNDTNPLSKAVPFIN